MKAHNLSIFALIMIFSVILMNSASADITFWRDINIDFNKSIVSSIGSYDFSDTSKSFLGKYKAVPIGIMYNWDNLPYNISFYKPQYQNAYVDWCNLTIVHTKYEYDSSGDTINTSVDTINYFVENQVADLTLFTIYLKHNDDVMIKSDCHYTNPLTLYIDGLTFADWGTYFPAFSCMGCEDKKLEELVNEVKYREESAVKEVQIYQKTQSMVNYNMNLWVIFSWIIKIGVIIIGVGLIFSLAMYLYTLIKSLGGRK